MNQSDHSLRRLLRAAARAPKPEPVSLPSRLETQLVARWRSAAPEDESALLAAFFRRAVIYASLVMALSIGWNWLENKGNDTGLTALTNYEAQLQVLP